MANKKESRPVGKPIKEETLDELILRVAREGTATTVDGIRAFVVSPEVFDLVSSRIDAGRRKLSHSRYHLLLEVNPFLTLGQNFYCLAVPIPPARVGPLDQIWAGVLT